MTTICMLREVIWEWGIRVFGIEHMQNPRKRALRFGEEAVEVMQVLGVTRGQVHLMVDVIYERPVGKLRQEIGGSMVTLLALCRCLDVNLEDVLYHEVQRVLATPPEQFAQRNQEKNELGL